MRIAILDIGTNTVLMLVADMTDKHSPIIIRDEHTIARLGEGVDKTKWINDASYNRFTKIMHGYSSIIKESHTEKIVAFATSAMRDAENRDEIIRRTKEEFDIDIELLSGTEEARWSFEGALFGIPSAEVSGVVAAVDIGGGSTELSFGTNGRYEQGVSINIGAVRIKERFLSGNKDAEPIAREYIRAELRPANPNATRPTQLVAVAGTPTSLAAMKLHLDHFDASAVDGTLISRSELHALVREMMSVDADELVRHYPSVSAARADILPAGAIILDEVMNMLGVDNLRVSTKGVRYGILLREIARVSLFNS